MFGEHELYRRHWIFIFWVQLDLHSLTADCVVQGSEGVRQHDGCTDRPEDLTVFQHRLTNTELVVVEGDVSHHLRRNEQHDSLLAFHVTSKHHAVDVLGLAQFVVARQSTAAQTCQQITFYGIGVDLAQLIDDLVLHPTRALEPTTGLLDDLRSVTIDVVHLRPDVIVVRCLVSDVDRVTVDVEHDVVTYVLRRVAWNVNRDHRLRWQVHDQRVTVGLSASLGMGQQRLYRNVRIATLLIHAALYRCQVTGCIFITLLGTGFQRCTLMQLAAIDATDCQLTLGIDDHRALEDCEVVTDRNSRTFVLHHLDQFATRFAELGAGLFVLFHVDQQLLEADLHVLELDVVVVVTVLTVITERQAFKRHASVAVYLGWSCIGVTQDAPRNIVAVVVSLFLQVAVQGLQSRLHRHAAVVIRVDDTVDRGFRHNQDWVAAGLEQYIVEHRMQQRSNPIGIIKELLDLPEKRP
ncbi:hypothetical protein D3C84_135580 [compost metagenome]